MRTYKPRKLVPGSVVHADFAGMELVALPEHTVMSGRVVKYDNREMIIDAYTPFVFISKDKFRDKFGGGEYRLYYFRWDPKPLTQLNLI